MSTDTDTDAGWARFAAESAYADSLVRSAIGDLEATIACLEEALEALPTYAPAIATLGSIDYQLDDEATGWRRFSSLLDLPDDDGDLAAVLANPATSSSASDATGTSSSSTDVRLPATERALELAPDDQELVNDLGWSLFEAGRLDEASVHLELAVAMDPEDALATENLRICRETHRGSS